MEGKNSREQHGKQGSGSEETTVGFFHVLSRIIYLLNNLSFVQVNQGKVAKFIGKNSLCLIISEFQIFMEGPADSSSDSVQEVHEYEVIHANHF